VNLLKKNSHFKSLKKSLDEKNKTKKNKQNLKVPQKESKENNKKNLLLCV